MRVLFVCLGNICRSPMAHGLFLHRVAERGLTGRLRADSAGTGAWHAGEPPDPRTLATLRRHGIDLAHRARQVVPEDFVRFDLLLAMDASNHRTLLDRAPPGSRDRVRTVLEPVGGGDVADPYYGGPEGFETNFAQLDRALAAWIDHLARGDGASMKLDG